MKIVTLPSMKVYVFKATSNTPEDDCWKKVNSFVKKYNLEGFKHYGFNNPAPEIDNPIYGYEMWISVEKNIIDPTIKIRIFNGGLYASLTSFMLEIGESWGKLNKLILEDKRYVLDYPKALADGVSQHQWLEECTNYKHFTDESIPFSEKQLDLLLPIKEV